VKDRSLPELPTAEDVLPPDTTVLDLLDNVLHKGVVVQGEVVIGLAGIDLVYLGANVILCAADRVVTGEGRPAKGKARR
jgi:hypothetical protein